MDAWTLVGGVLLGALLAPVATTLMQRVPAGEALRPAARCGHCAATIPVRHQVAIVSWLWLRGRCDACGRSIGWRYPVVEALTLFAVSIVLLQPWPWPVQAAWIAFTPLALALAVIDRDHHLLPDLLTLRGAALVAAVLAIDGLVSGWPPLLRALQAAAALFVVYLLMNLLTRGQMGMGDVKLALAIGLLAGRLGWFEVLLATLLAFVISGGYSAALLLARRASLKSHIPFGPFMLAGLLLVPVLVEPARGLLLP